MAKVLIVTTLVIRELVDTSTYFDLVGTEQKEWTIDQIRSYEVSRSTRKDIVDDLTAEDDNTEVDVVRQVHEVVEELPTEAKIRTVASQANPRARFR